MLFRASPNGLDGIYRLNVEVDGTPVKSNRQFRVILVRGFSTKSFRPKPKRGWVGKDYFGEKSIY